MNYNAVDKSDLNIEFSSFRPVHGGVEEFQVFLRSTDILSSFDEQCGVLLNAVSHLSDYTGCHCPVIVFGRFFLSDVINQKTKVESAFSTVTDCTFSYVQQPSLDCSKVALWLMLQSEGESGCDKADGLRYIRHNDYAHYHVASPVVQIQHLPKMMTFQLFGDLNRKIMRRKGTLADNCLRTWIYVRDIDLNYAEVVKGRKEYFPSIGMTPRTHYIVSTGIGVTGIEGDGRVLIDSYFVLGISKEQIHFVYAKDYMNATIEYGVTFERGMYVDYGDRRKVYISGTASIDTKGQVVHQGDIEGQTRRMWENVEALLAEAECTPADMSMIVVYLRDVSDYPKVKAMFEVKYPHCPTVIVLAPVCRPEWLIEMECMAGKEISGNKFRAY